MVAHQDIGVNPPGRPLTRLPQGLKETGPVRIILENILLPIPPAHHVIDRPRKFHSHLPRHRISFSLRLPENARKKD